MVDIILKIILIIIESDITVKYLAYDVISKYITKDDINIAVNIKNDCLISSIK
jgi:hypothetical protein